MTHTYDVFYRTTRLLSVQRWRKWTLLDGCVKPWGSISPARPPEQPNEADAHAHNLMTTPNPVFSVNNDTLSNVMTLCAHTTHTKLLIWYFYRHEGLLKNTCESYFTPESRPCILYTEICLRDFKMNTQTIMIWS